MGERAMSDRYWCVVCESWHGGVLGDWHTASPQEADRIRARKAVRAPEPPHEHHFQQATGTVDHLMFCACGEVRSMAGQLPIDERERLIRERRV